MPFMKVIKKTKGVPKKIGSVVLIEDEEVASGIVEDSDGNQYPIKNLAMLTEEEAAECLEVETIDLGI